MLQSSPMMPLGYNQASWHDSGFTRCSDGARLRPQGRWRSPAAKINVMMAIGVGSAADVEDWIRRRGGQGNTTSAAYGNTLHRMALSGYKKKLLEYMPT